MKASTAGALLTGLAGPLAAWLHETGTCCLAGTHAAIWVVVAVGGLGVAAAVGWILAGARATGIAALIANTAVLSLYGFPAVFFLVGGSR